MCGVVGVVSSKNVRKVELATSRISHRGPDDFGIYYDKNLGLGHRRLSILDLSINGHQPMICVQNRYVLVYNGEIYNHQELRKSRLSGVQFKGHSDSETLLYGLINYGLDFLNLLNGIFAFCFYDKETGNVLLGRDQLGVKPLYYYHKDEEFYFSSEMKALLSFDIDQSLDISSISDYLYFLYSPGESTPFRNVKKLLPGHILTFNINAAHDIKIKKYYELPFIGSYSDFSFNEHVKITEEKLLKAVERQMMSDVPVGFFLSGGLDSSAIVALAKSLYPKRSLSCYTIDTDGGFDGFKGDLYYAKMVANHLDVDLHIIPSKIDIVHEFDRMIWHLDEPQADPAPLHVFNICEKARGLGEVVLLGGTAGDDVFSGYRRHQALRYERIFKNVPSAFWNIANLITNNLSCDKAVIRRLKKLLVDANKSPLERWTGYYGWLSHSDAMSIFNKSHHEELKKHDFNKLFINSLENISNEKNSLNKMLYWELKYFLADHNLNYTDKMSMAKGVEVRVPFLDLELVNYSTTIPPEFKMKGNEVKYILKKVMEKYLPKEVIYRPKTGFGAPVRTWIKNDLRDMVTERLSESEINKWGIFDYNAIQTMIRNNDSGKKDNSYSIWALLSIQSWLEQFSKKQ